ncbi:MAG: ferrochelatase [Thermoplasmataceae archaeon]
MVNENKIAILLASYGSPEKKEDLMEYLRDVFNGRDPPEFAMKETDRKYSTVEYISPSGAIIQNILHGIEENLRKNSAGKEIVIVNTYKHWKPSLIDSAKDFVDQGIRRIYIIPLFPLRATSIFDSYLIPLKSFVKDNGEDIEIVLISGICEQKSFVEIWKDNISKILSDGDYLLFTAHSLPKLKEEEKTYHEDFEKSSNNIAMVLGTTDFGVAYQSQGPYGSKWMGPNIYEVLEKIKSAGYRRIVTAPIGFLYDHLEILYDLDILFANKVREYGMKYARAESPNSQTKFVKLLSDLIEERINVEEK